MAVKPAFTETEINHYKTMVGLIISGDPKKKQELDGQARLSIAQAKSSMPNADTETLVSFFGSIAFLMAHLMTTQVKNIAEVMEATFDSYTIAAAHMMEVYDIEGDTVPVKPEPTPKSPYAASPNTDNRDTGLYL